MAGLTLDTGALVAIAAALEGTGSKSTRRRVVDVWEKAVKARTPITVPSLVLCEFWRGQQSGPVVKLVRALSVDDLDRKTAQAIGVYLGKSGGRTGPSMVDACVVISAARRGDAVYTSDPDDLTKVVDDLGLGVPVHTLDE